MTTAQRWITTLFTLAALHSVVDTDLPAADFEKSMIYQLLTAKEDTREPQLIALEEMLKTGKISKSTKIELTAARAKIFYEKLVNDLKGDLAESLKAVSQEVDALDPKKKEDRNRLQEISRVVKVLRTGIRDLENGLHDSADALMLVNATLEATSMSTFAILWVREIPAARKSLARLDYAIDDKLKTDKRVAILSRVETFKDDVTPPPSLRWASMKMKEYDENVKAKVKGKSAEAKLLRDYSKSVIEALPRDTERSAFEDAVYGRYQGLVNTLNIYLNAKL